LLTKVTITDCEVENAEDGEAEVDALLGDEDGEECVREEEAKVQQPEICGAAYVKRVLFLCKHLVFKFKGKL
jgi:hypothetical protein